MEETPRHLFFNFHMSQQSEMQASQLEAWRTENAGDPWEAAQAWEDFAMLLIGSNSPERFRSNPALYAAAALRRPEYRFIVLSHATRKTQPDVLEKQFAKMLEHSLEYDPDDMDCHLRLIRYYRNTAQLKDARRVLNQAQQSWPKDKNVLIEAMETALAGGAYKKAAGLARDILDIDPINSGVRERLVAAHVAHSRKHLRGKRSDLAEKSVAEAATWAISERARERVELAQGFVGLATHPEVGESELRSLSKRLGDGLTARLVLALEAEQSGHRLTNLLKRLNLLKAPTTERHDLLSFFKRLRDYLEAGVTLSKDMSKYFVAPLRQAARLQLDKTDVESACETLRRADMQSSRANFAKAALKRRRGEPVFEYHELDAKLIEHGLWRFEHNDINRLERAQDRARANGDMRLVERIHDTLSPFGGPIGFGPPVPPFNFDPDALDDTPLQPLEMLAELIRTIGIDDFWGLLQEENEIGEAIREMQNAIGAPLFRSMVEQLAEAADNASFSPFDDDFEPIERLPRPKTKKTRPNKQFNSENEVSDDKPPTQKDLFE